MKAGEMYGFVEMAPHCWEAIEEAQAIIAKASRLESIFSKK